MSVYVLLNLILIRELRKREKSKFFSFLQLVYHSHMQHCMIIPYLILYLPVSIVQSIAHSTIDSKSDC